VVIQGDGMADHPLEDLSDQTPLEAANTPNMDEVASSGKLGTVTTIPVGLPPGSSVGNMSLMGLNPEVHFTGRAPLEAKGRGIDLDDEDIVLRCNLVKIGEAEAGKFMEDYSGGHPPLGKAEKYVDLLDEELGRDGFKFYSGVGYRNLLVWSGGRREVEASNLSLTPPHDITGELIDNYLPEGPTAERFIELQDRASRILAGKDESFNGIWLWGQGVKPDLPTFKERYGLDGVVVSAVDLIKGLGAYSGLTPIEVEGATGSIDTNYEGKVSAVEENLESGSIAYLHIEAPDEASHAGNLEKKIKAIELIDRRIVKFLLDFLDRRGDSRLLLVTDHLTGIESRTHERGPVPFAITEFNRHGNSSRTEYSEREAAHAGKELDTGAELLKLFLNGEVG